MKIRAAALTALLCATATPPCFAADKNLGEVSFANSCNDAAQAPLQRGVALLHDFEYEDAAIAFQQAKAADQSCGIAVWGEAMTYNHPIWMEQDLAGGRAALDRLAPTPYLRDGRVFTLREKAYMHAVETLFGDGTKAERDNAYAEEMKVIHERFPDDVDATAFYALALLGTCHNGRDIPTYMKAAAELEEVFPTHQHHPGVLHYMIHAYDDPAHAPLGMRAARLYGAIASGAPHAVHMTSHIFIALGMWDEVIKANDDAIHALDMKQPGAAKFGACGHYAQWLIYGLLQERRFPEAETAIGQCRANATEELAKHPQSAFPTHSAVAEYAELITRAAIETGQWHSDTAMPMDDGAFVEARFLEAYAAALFAGTDTARLQAALGTMRDMSARLKNRPPSDDQGTDKQQLQFWTVMIGQAEALQNEAAGHRNDAIVALRVLSDKETALPSEFGPPAVPKPTQELLGDLLLKSGQPSQAADAYRVALVHAPGRTLSLQGLLAAELALGDKEAARATRDTLANYVRPASSPPGQ